MSDSLYMTAEEAAQALGVNVTTIYAYVSRKLIRSHKISGERAARYWRADIERIRQKLPGLALEIAANPLVSDTKITVLTEAGPFYRGRSALALAETETLESVAALLWQTQEAAVFTDTPPKTPDALIRHWPLLDGVNAIDMSIASFPVIERDNPRVYDLSPAGFTRTAADVMRWFAAMMMKTPEVSSAPLHKVITEGTPNGAALEDVVRRLLVLSADHELEPATYAVRAVANTGVNPYRVTIAGLVASTGRRLSYGRTDALSRMLDEIFAAPDPRDAVVGRLREGEPLPGFGSALYRAGDPRAAALLTALNRSLDGDRELTRLNAAAEVVREVTDLHPDLSLVNLFIGRKLGLEGGEGRMALRLGRIAGWIAHAMEQYHGHEVVRPRAQYTGVLPTEDLTPLPLPQAPPRRGRRPRRTNSP